jgi:hypothetical protein
MAGVELNLHIFNGSYDLTPNVEPFYRRYGNIEYLGRDGTIVVRRD